MNVGAPYTDLDLKPPGPPSLQVLQSHINTYVTQSKRKITNSNSVYGGMIFLISYVYKQDGFLGSLIFMQDFC